MSVRRVTLHCNCHVQVDGSYYPAPFICVGKKLDAYIYERVVQIYNGVELLVTHPKPDWIESGWRRPRPSRSFASMNTRVRRASSSQGTS